MLLINYGFNINDRLLQNPEEVRRKIIGQTK
jgi:hypothetical protein